MVAQSVPVAQLEAPYCPRNPSRGRIAYEHARPRAPWWPSPLWLLPGRMWAAHPRHREEQPVAEAPALVKPVNRPLAAILAVAALVAVGAAAVLALAPPTARPADAPTGEFSAERAYRHVSVVAAE